MDTSRESPTLPVIPKESPTLPVILPTDLPEEPIDMSDPLPWLKPRHLKRLFKTSFPSPPSLPKNSELPIRCRMHLDILSLFFSVWSNPRTKVFKLVKYILMMTDLNYTTWANHVRLICIQYGLPDPLGLLQQLPPSHKAWRESILTKITVHTERS